MLLFLCKCSGLRLSDDVLTALYLRLRKYRSNQIHLLPVNEFSRQYLPFLTTLSSKTSSLKTFSCFSGSLAPDSER